MKSDKKILFLCFFIGQTLQKYFLYKEDPFGKKTPLFLKALTMREQMVPGGQGQGKGKRKGKGPPRIVSLRVENYRALRQAVLDDLTPLTVLIGPNGSGKSTLLDVFKVSRGVL